MQRELKLTIEHRRGKPWLAYLYFEERGPGCVKYTLEEGLLIVDYGFDDVPIGIELIYLVPEMIGQLHRHVAELGLPRVPDEVLAPLYAAWES